MNFCPDSWMCKKYLANQLFFNYYYTIWRKLEILEKKYPLEMEVDILICLLFSFLGTGVIKTVKTGYLLHFKSKWILYAALSFCFWNHMKKKHSFHVWQLLLGAYPMIAIKKFGSKILFTFFYYMVQLCAIYNFR